MMERNHKYFSLAIGVVFSFSLQAFSASEPVFRFLLPFMLFYGGAVLFYNWKYLSSRGQENFWVALQPVLLLFAVFGVFFFLPSPFFRSLLVLAGLLVVVLAELGLGNFAENLKFNEALAAAFGFFLTLAGLDQYFPALNGLSLWLGPGRGWHWDVRFSLQPFYLALAFFLPMIQARIFYEFVPKLARAKWVAAVAMGLFSAQLFWAASFLPFHFSARAVILFSLFYFCLILNYYHLFNNLSLKKIQFHLALATASCVVAVLATPWQVLQ